MARLMITGNLKRIVQLLMVISNIYNIFYIYIFNFFIIDGVLGGFGALTPMDSKGSNEFLDKLVNLLPDLKLNKAADCGAGIGRVTKSFLMNRFEYIDLIEQSPRLLNNSFNYLKLDEEEYKRRIGLINLGLQNFLPEKNSYDVIWIQWVVGHLHDLDFIKFFKRCAEGLREGGCIILKDNTIKNNSELFCLDLDDNSVCRNKKYLDILFEFCNLEIIYEEYQKDFPPELYPVAMIALRLKK